MQPRSACCKPEQEGFHLGITERRRVPKAVEADQGPNPIDIYLLRAYAVVQIANALVQLVEHLRGLQRGQEFGAAFHGCLTLYRISALLSQS